MEHEARQRGVRIHHSVCGHGEERMIAGYPVDGFLPGGKNAVPVPQLPLAWLSRVLGVVSRFGGD